MESYWDKDDYTELRYYHFRMRDYSMTVGLKSCVENTLRELMEYKESKIEEEADFATVSGLAFILFFYSLI